MDFPTELNYQVGSYLGFASYRRTSFHLFHPTFPPLTSYLTLNLAIYDPLGAFLKTLTSHWERYLLPH